MIVMIVEVDRNRKNFQGVNDSAKTLQKYFGEFQSQTIASLYNTGVHIECFFPGKESSLMTGDVNLIKEQLDKFLNENQKTPSYRTTWGYEIKYPLNYNRLDVGGWLIENGIIPTNNVSCLAMLSTCCNCHSCKERRKREHTCEDYDNLCKFFDENSGSTICRFNGDVFRCLLFEELMRIQKAGYLTGRVYQDFHNHMRGDD